MPICSDNKRSNNRFDLLFIEGDEDNPLVIDAKTGMTNIKCLVYNDITGRTSVKTAVLHPKTNRLYLRSRYGRLYLDEFKPKGAKKS